MCSNDSYRIYKAESREPEKEEKNVDVEHVRASTPLLEAIVSISK